MIIGFILLLILAYLGSLSLSWNDRIVCSQSHLPSSFLLVLIDILFAQFNCKLFSFFELGLYGLVLCSSYKIKEISQN